MDGSRKNRPFIKKKPYFLGGNYIDHCFKNSIPSIWGFQGGVREHTSVPANMLDTTILKIFQPVTGTTGNIELAVRVICWAMLSSFVM